MYLGPFPKIIFSDHKEIRQIDMEKNTISTLVDGLKSAIGVDFSWEEQMVYWSDVSEDKIERMNFNGTGRQEVVNQGMNSPEGKFV